MPSAPIPENERERIAELKSYCVLDTNAEERFDRIVKIAAEVVGSPVALISLIDDDRQWFKAKLGLDVVETTRELAFCGYVVHDHQTLVIEDATQDPRVKDNALVTGEPHIRFYAGVPITTPNDYILGSLCVIDFEPRTISDSNLKVLHLLAAQVASQLEYSRTISELQASQVKILDAQHEAEAASKSKSVFLASMSHELRTPMNSIIGFTRRLIKRLKKQAVGDDDIDALATVERNAEQLLALINDIIDLSRLEAGVVKVRRSEFDVGFLLQSIHKSACEKAAAKGIELILSIPEEPLTIKADRTKLLQIGNNLVNNAIRFTDEGRVTISLELIEGDKFIIRVADTGTGMTKENMANLFQKFTQFDKDESKRRGGTGIGLTISSEYARLHGGYIEATSEYGKGSEFTVTLPLACLGEEITEGVPHGA